MLLVSTVQQSESAIRTHISPLFWISFSFRSPQSTEPSGGKAVNDFWPWGMTVKECCKIRLGIWQYLLGDLRCIHISINNQFWYKTIFLNKLLIAKIRLKLKKTEKTTRPFRYGLNQIPYSYTVEVINRFKGLDLIECLKNYGWRFLTLYRRQWSRPSPRKRNAKRQSGCLRRTYR